jgi:hypothetical protein
LESLYDETMHKYSGTANSNAVKEIRTRNKVHVRILKSSDKDVLHDFIIKIVPVSYGCKSTFPLCTNVFSSLQEQLLSGKDDPQKF